jgi:hypothetical protein
MMLLPGLVAQAKNNLSVYCLWGSVAKFNNFNNIQRQSKTHSANYLGDVPEFYPEI